MSQDFVMGQLRLALVAFLAYAGGKGWITPTDAGLFTTLATTLGPLIAPWLWSIIVNVNKKSIPVQAIAIDPIYSPANRDLPTATVTTRDGGTMTGKVLGFVAALFLVATLFLVSFATDLRAADLALKSPATMGSITGCVPQNCSGWYAGVGIMGDGSNADIIGQGVNGSVFSEGGIIKVQGGYQLWKDTWFAAFEISAGYEFTTAVSSGVNVANKGGSKIIGTELIKLGYNFFPNAGSALTSPSQSPAPLTVPASLLAASTPYLVFGGMQRRGINQWVNGVGIDTVVAAGLSSGVKYLYAPSQQGVPATHVVMVELNKHF